jgi:hypothetical protein
VDVLAADHLPPARRTGGPLNMRPVFEEADLGLPLQIHVLRTVARVQAQSDCLIAGHQGTPTDRVLVLALVVGEVDAQLDGEQVAREDRIGAGIDETGELRSASR